MNEMEVPFIFRGITEIAKAIISFFEKAGAEFLDWTIHIVPMVLVALTLLNVIVRLVGEERFERFAHRCTGNIFARYLVLPYLSAFFMGSPSGHVFGKYLKEHQKPGFFEVTNRTCMAPMMTMFPHVNPAELFVWLGIYNGVVKRYGLETGALLGIVTFLLATVTSVFIGFTVEKISLYIARQKGIDLWDSESVNERRKEVA